MMQSYGDFLPIPRKLPNYSRSCMDKLQTSGQIGEIVPIPVQKQSKTYMNVTQAQVVIPPRTKHTMSGVECGVVCAGTWWSLKSLSKPCNSRNYFLSYHYDIKFMRFYKKVWGITESLVRAYYVKAKISIQKSSKTCSHIYLKLSKYIQSITFYYNWQIFSILHWVILCIKVSLSITFYEIL